MSDIRDWGRFIRSRWDWTRYGYERGFPRGCQFTDVDAGVEFDDRSLLIETKHHENEMADFTPVSRGQRLYFQDEVQRGKAVLVLYGCGCCNNPYGVYDVGADRWYDWRGQTQSERRVALKALIDEAMGLVSLSLWNRA